VLGHGNGVGKSGWAGCCVMMAGTHPVTAYSCVLCSSPECTFYCKDNFRSYLRCSSCNLIYVPPEYHLSTEEEKNRYSKHTNTSDDKKYVAYLSDVADNALALPVRSPRVLDFGSGPNQVLAGIINARGVYCASHDPLYGINADNGGELFDIIVACEVFEHLRDIKKEIRLIGSLLKPGGFVYVHTQLYDDVKDIPSWWYLKDPTHISFYCEKTMRTIAEILGKKIYSINKKDTVVLR
jgi:SAM-dependent methyltransferase